MTLQDLTDVYSNNTLVTQESICEKNVIVESYALKCHGKRYESYIHAKMYG